jgi:signal transduction histidine kinase
MGRSMTARGRLSKPVAVTLLGLALSAVLACVLNVTGLTSPTPLPETTAMIRALAAPAFLAAGFLRLARWRITGERHCGLRAVALLLMGGFSLPSAALARGLVAPGTDLAMVTCVRALTVGTTLYVMAVALNGDDSDRDHLARKVGWLTLTTAAVTVLLLTERDHLPPEQSLQLALTRGMATALAISWLVVAAGALVKARHTDWAKPAAPLLAAMGIAEMFRIPDHPAATLVAAGLTAAVGFLLASFALVDLVRAAHEEHDTSLLLSRALATARDEVGERDAWHEELSHDARSTLAGIRAAMWMLERHVDELGAATADRLRVATFAELTHLEGLLVRGDHDPDVFDMAEVVRSVTDLRRAAGLSIDMTLRPAWVRGVPADAASVVQNLLVNAQVHAPGAHVLVDVRRDRDLVRITVADDGPGMPAVDVTTAFDRGSRGSGSRGSGLGLSIARSAVRRHGGELELVPSQVGTTFVVTWPAVETSRDARLEPVPVAS